jgi:uncharacterized protein (TIGR03086 family)
MQLADATPCANFTVHDVLDHMMVGGATFAHAFRGEQAPELKTPAVQGVVPTAEFRSAMDGLLAAVRSDGAMERTISSPVGEMSGEAFARFVAFDGLVHGWDLATATGLRFEVPPAVVDAVDEFARAAISPEMRDGDTFKDATTPPAGATPIERLVAFSGRSV